MLQRERREKPAVKAAGDAESLVTQAARARMARLTGAGVSGLGASTMAFVVGGCLALGYFAGTWLDNRYSTTHWMPIGVFVGLAASVREMFRTLRQLNAQTQRELHQRQAQKQQQIERQSQHRVLDTANQKSSNAKHDNYADTEPETIRPRIFYVPPPPLASFDDGFVDDSFVQDEADSGDTLTEDELHEDELKKLLREIDIDDARDEDEPEAKSV